MNRYDCRLELKFAPDAEAMSFDGYGAVFGNVDAYGDVIEPGAFAQYLSQVKSGEAPWPAMLSQHGGMGLGADDMTPIGVWTDLVEDGTGLRVAGRLADTPRGREMYALMKMEPRPAIDGLSIGYIPKTWEPRSKPDDPKRRLTRIDLIEISMVTRPANSRARVSAVKAADMTERDIERLLTQDAGLTRSEARALMRGGLQALKATQDAGPESEDIAQLLAAIKRRGQALA